MTDLPPELDAFASILDAQPAPVRDAFQYCLCLLMVEAGKMRLVEKRSSENGRVCVFVTSVGDRFSVARPAMGGGVNRQVGEDIGGGSVADAKRRRRWVRH
jgi:hypothetical protein